MHLSHRDIYAHLLPLERYVRVTAPHPRQSATAHRTHTTGHLCASIGNRKHKCLVHNRLAGQQGAFCFGCLRGRRPRRQLGCTSATTRRSSAGAAGSLGDAAVWQLLALAAWQRVSLGDHRPAVGTTAWRHSLPTELRLLPTEQRHNRTDDGERFRSTSEHDMKRHPFRSASRR